MIKKGLIAASSLAVAFITTAGLTLAQSPSPTSSPMVSPSPSSSPSTTVPGGAPATGHGG